MHIIWYGNAQSGGPSLDANPWGVQEIRHQHHEMQIGRRTSLDTTLHAGERCVIGGKKRTADKGGP